MKLLLLLMACPPPVYDDPTPNPEADADIFVDQLGDPIAGLDAERLALYERGAEMMERVFTTTEGLGPTFNTDSCAGCHQFPVAGGSGPRYRDFWLVKAPRWDGTLIDGGSNGQSPVRNLYMSHNGHVPEPEDTVLYARRNAPSALGVGLFAFISDETILANADEDDLDGDGISGRPNYEQNRVGRLGYKSQASSMESFNRGAILNQMGLTTNPLFHEFEEDPDRVAALEAQQGPLGWLGLQEAWAQVSAPGQPTLDDDDVPDPEVSDEDQLALLIFSTYVGVPRPTADLSEEAEAGAALFTDLGCAACHVPRLDSTIGPLPAYSDLLLHDMGEDLADGIGAGLAMGSEFRTQPLWGVQLHGPFLHDGRADSMEQAIEWHGGEGQASADAWLALSEADQSAVIAFLRALGGHDPDHQILVQPGDAAPEYGELGGPDMDLSAAELDDWAAGRALFDRSMLVDDGLGTTFNADACRACHRDPVLGGSGGVDTNVLRIGVRDAQTGAFSNTSLGNALPRVTTWDQLPVRLPDEVNVIEHRNPPSVLGIGLLGRIPEADILALADPDDLDGDGISGRAHYTADGSLGRLGWKAQVPGPADFAADAAFHELGLTLDGELSAFAIPEDDDAIADPELPVAAWASLGFYLEHLGPPLRKTPEDAAQAAEGEALFSQVGCADCHVPVVGGVSAWTDLLLHDVAPDEWVLVDQDDVATPTEYRTPPLWGISDTAPYLHDGSAPTLSEAVLLGHFGEAEAARGAYEALSEAERAALIAYLETL
ncbi:MAG: c-type cytochrome [Alphaproteobacteria bacterium]|nr:c-type cytochrome [Alphaproteobacteria bacterium]MCB9796649.1 c-type cytochrome [Alphaproteobacteria bacterium]